jgi:hypothetical protein
VTWTELVLAAILETDDTKLQERLDAAEEAIHDRLRQLEHQRDVESDTEIDEMVSTLENLSTLRAERLERWTNGWKTLSYFFAVEGRRMIPLSAIFENLYKTSKEGQETRRRGLSDHHVESAPDGGRVIRFNERGLDMVASLRMNRMTVYQANGDWVATVVDGKLTGWSRDFRRQMFGF